MVESIAELFGLTIADVVKSAGTAAIEWGTRKFLDVIVGCPNCGRKFLRKKLPNHADNGFVCYACFSKILAQHTNATRHTVRRDNSIVAARTCNLSWSPRRSFLSSSVTGYHPVVDVQTSNSRDNDIVVKFTLLPRDRRRSIALERILCPDSHSATFRAITTPRAIDTSDLPKPTDGLILEIDAVNSHGEKLQNTVSRILSYDGRAWNFAAM